MKKHIAVTVTNVQGELFIIGQLVFSDTISKESLSESLITQIHILQNLEGLSHNEVVAEAIEELSNLRHRLEETSRRKALTTIGRVCRNLDPLNVFHYEILQLISGEEYEDENKVTG